MMDLTLNTIRDNRGARRKPKVLGRGIGSGLGKTCGRGGKGQTARSGVSLNGFEGGQNPIYRRLPKRGFKNIHAANLLEMSLASLVYFAQKHNIDEKTVIDLSLLRQLDKARVAHEGLSVFGVAECPRAMTIVVDRISKSAKDLIEKAGGSVTVLEKKDNSKKKKEDA